MTNTLTRQEPTELVTSLACHAVQHYTSKCTKNSLLSWIFILSGHSQYSGTSTYYLERFMNIWFRYIFNRYYIHTVQNSTFCTDQDFWPTHHRLFYKSTLIYSRQLSVNIHNYTLTNYNFICVSYNYDICVLAYLGRSSLSTSEIIWKSWQFHKYYSLRH